MKSKSILIFINLAILIALITAGFWPFEFKPVNNVHRLKNNNGLLLIRNNLVLEENSLSQPGLLSRINNNGILTIEILLKPYPATRNWLSNILCFYDDDDPELLMLAKWKSELIIRRRIQPASRLYAYHEVGVPNVLSPNRANLVTVTMNTSGTTVYIDGRESAVFPKFIFNPHKQDLSKTRIMIGNDPRVRVPWEGEILGVAFYKSALNRQDISRHYAKWRGHDYISLSRENDMIALYPMNERSGRVIQNVTTGRNNLIIPKHLFAVKKSILSRPWINFWREIEFYKDLIINILGFIPLGFFLLALFVFFHKKTRALYDCATILIGTCLSLTIELIQAYMPARTSSLTDLLCNILGTMLGVVIFHKVHTVYISKTKKPDGSGFSIKG